MNTIYKYPLSLIREQVVTMPQGAKVVAAAEQRGTLCLWAEVDTEAPSVGRLFCIYGTGQLVDREDRTHIGSVLMDTFVWHVYEVAL